METALGCGYLKNEEFGVTDFYSPPSSINDEDDNLFYYEENNNTNDDNDIESLSIEQINNQRNFSSSSINENNDMILKNENKSSPLKLMSIETTPPPTPLISQRLFDPINNTAMAFQNMTINTNLPLVSSRNTDIITSNWSVNASSASTNSLFPYPTNNISKTTTNLLTPTSMDRYLIEHCRLSDSIYKSSTPLGTTTNRHQSISVQHTEVTNERSRLYSYMAPVDGLTATTTSSSCNSWSNFDNKLSIPSQEHINNNSYTPQLNMKNSSYLNNSLLPQQGINSNNSFNHSQHPWFLSEISTILQQNNTNTNISLSTTAQQILAGNTANNNRPLRSEKIDIEIIKHLIQEANWKRQCGMKKEVCVFCRNNGENEVIYSSHSLKDSIGNVTCPILRAYQCPICGATGSQAHTIKYCQATGDDSNRHVPTPYEKMLRMQILGFDDNITSPIPSFFGQLDSPSSLYTNGWSNSYL